MKQLLILNLIAAMLLCAVSGNAQGKWQIAKAGTKPYYTNEYNHYFVCDSSTEQPVAKDTAYYCVYIRYLFNDTINHPLFTCGHKGSYSFRRYRYKTGNGENWLNDDYPNYTCDQFGANYCDICNKKIQVYYYPKDSLIADYGN